MTSILKYGLPISTALILNYLRSREIECFFVGGVIRDSIISSETHEPGDIDIVIEGDALIEGKKMSQALGGVYVELDAKHGICRVVLKTGSGQTYFDLSSSNHGIVKNLESRDFTLNAMALNIEHVETLNQKHFFYVANLLDPFGGLKDIGYRVINSVSETSVINDPIRTLRAIRISQRFRFQISEDTSRQIKKSSNLINNVSNERIRDELLKIFSMSGTAESLRLMDDFGILDKIFPEIIASKCMLQPAEHFWPVFDHLIETVSKLEKILQNDGNSNQEPEDFALELIPHFDDQENHFREIVGDSQTRLTLCKIACLLHDIAKPTTRTIDNNNRIRFLGHDKKGSEMTEVILKRLRFSRAATSIVATQVRQHLRPSQMAPKGELPSKKAMYRYYRDLGEESIDTLFLNMADYMAARGPLLKKDEWKAHCKIINHIISSELGEKKPQKQERLVTGHDIMDRLRLSPGPHIGILIEEVTESYVEGKVTTKEEAMELVRKLVESGDYLEKEC